MTMTEEAKVLLRIAKVLDKLDNDERRCAVMAAACAAIGQYDYAASFAKGAEEKRQEQCAGEGT